MKQWLSYVGLGVVMTSLGFLLVGACISLLEVFQALPIWVVGTILFTGISLSIGTALYLGDKER